MRKICVICKEHIEEEDGWIEKHLGISGASVLYHESCFLSPHRAHLTQDAADFRKARGVIPWKEGDELPEDAVRRLRGG